MNENFLYKKAYFQSARRAILENEIIMCKFTESIVKNNYSEEKLERFNNLLKTMNDNDMLDLITRQKQIEDFNDKYDIEICTEILNFVSITKVI